jgi:hypothetical protein
MNDLKNYVEYAQPVIKAIRENHNQFHLLQYFTVSPEDLTVEAGLLNFMSETKNRPEHFSGNISLVYAQWGEETGASIVLEISPEQRKLLSPEVLDVILNTSEERGNASVEEWRKHAKIGSYILMDHEYYSDVAGFVLSDSWGGVRNNVGEATDFLSHRLGIPYYSINNPDCGLEYHLNMMSQYPDQVDPADEDHIYFNADPGEKPK